MDNDIKKLYDFYRENALLITKMQRAAELYRRQLHHNAGVLAAEISRDLGNLEAFPRFMDKASFQNGVLGIISSLQSEDYVLCADSLNYFINGVLIPLQMSLLEELNECCWADSVEMFDCIFNGKEFDIDNFYVEDFGLFEKPAFYPDLSANRSPNL